MSTLTGTIDVTSSTFQAKVDNVEVLINMETEIQYRKYMCPYWRFQEMSIHCPQTI